MPYPRFQSMFDANALPGLLNYWKSVYLGALSDTCIDAITDHAAGMTSPLTQVHLSICLERCNGSLKMPWHSATGCILQPQHRHQVG